MAVSESWWREIPNAGQDVLVENTRLRDDDSALHRIDSSGRISKSQQVGSEKRAP